MNAIDEVFGRLRPAGRKAFMPFITAGDPSMDATGDLLRDLDDAGSHLIEIGFPFSDPIADGSVIQASYSRALERGFKVEQLFETVERIQTSGRPLNAPLVGMASYTLVHRRGPGEFAARARKAGFSGLILPDLPAEEAEGFTETCDRAGLCNILLVTPTTPAQRAEKIVRLCRGFVYCVSVTGITGERDRLPPELQDQLRRLRGMTSLPLCVGFGISRPDQVPALRHHADGIIVGSAIVRRLENATEANWPTRRQEIRTFAGQMLAALG